MKLLIANVIALMGGFLTVFSYYHLDRYYERYLKFREGTIAKQEGWGKAYFEVMYRFDKIGRWAIQVTLSLISYLMIGFGIVASIYTIKTQNMVLLYAIAIGVIAILFNIFLLAIERRSFYSLSIQDKGVSKGMVAEFIRLELVNVLVASSIVIGVLLSKIDIAEVSIAAILYLLIVNAVILTAFRYFRKSEG